MYAALKRVRHTAESSNAITDARRKSEEVEAIQQQKIRIKEETRLCWDSKRIPSAINPQKNCEGSHWSFRQKIQNRQKSVPRRIKIRSTRNLQTFRKCSNALGANPKCKGPLSHYWSDHIRWRDPTCCLTNLRSAVGNNVDYDEKIKKRSETFQKNEIPSIRWRRASPRLWRQYFGNLTTWANQHGVRSKRR